MSGREAFVERASTLLLVSAGFVLLVGLLIGVTTAGGALPGVLNGDASGDQTQVDPSTIESESDLSAFERRLAERVEGQIQSGALNLSAGEYERLRGVLNSSEYDGLAESYGSVSRGDGSGAEGGDGTSAVDDLTRLRRSLTAYSRHAEEYWQAYAAYQTARYDALLQGQPSEEETRLARRLLQLERQVNASGERALSIFGSLERDRRLNVSEAVESVRSDRRNISTAQVAVSAQSLTETRLDLTPASTTIAFDRPLELGGTLRTAAGTPLANESATIAVGNRTFDVLTDADGRFSLSYRPVELPLGNQTLVVEYRPNETAPYLGAERTLNVTVGQADSAISVSVSPDSLQYNDTITVSGRVAAGAVTGDGIPVRVRVGERVLGTTTTNAAGEYSVTGSIPDSLPAGETPVRASVPLEDRALTGSAGETTVELRERATDLSVSSVSVEEEVVQVAGSVTFEDGTPAANRTVTVAAGEDTTMATSGSDGSFEASFVASDADDGESLNVTVRFDATGSNLQSATATRSVTVTQAGLPLWLYGVGLAGVAVLGGLALFVWRRRSGEESDSDPVVEDSGASVEDESVRRPSDAEDLLAASRESVESDDPERAVRLAYAAMRASLDGPSDVTHWEFYRNCAMNGYDTETVETLRELTEEYERARFAAGPVSPRVAEGLVSTVASVTETKVE